VPQITQDEAVRAVKVRYSPIGTIVQLIAKNDARISDRSGIDDADDACTAARAGSVINRLSVSV